MIELDGSMGEGGGQILRTALSLSMITGQPFRIDNIRAKRPKPGLLRQHLVALQAAGQVCDSDVSHARLGLQSLEFFPGKIQGGDYTFAIGSAGSCTLVLQTLLPALLFAPNKSTIRISGGTHNGMAPPAEFLQRAYAPILARMGAQVQFDVLRHGFYPAGGGEMLAQIAPCAKLQALHLLERGERTGAYAESLFAHLPYSIAQRELAVVGAAMGWADEHLLPRGISDSQGPGNVVLLSLQHEQVSEVFCAFGERGVSAETVAKKAVGEARQYIASGAALGEHLADQVMLPFALAGAGSFTCSKLSDHTVTNAKVIEEFLPVKFSFEKQNKLFYAEIK